MQNGQVTANLQMMLQKDISELVGKDKELLNHYAKTLGGQATNIYKVVNIPEYFPGPFYIVEAEVNIIGAFCMAYCSIGASHGKYPYDQNWTGPRQALLAEYIVYSRKPNIAVAEVVKELILYPFVQKSFLDVNHTLDFGSNSIIDSAPMTTAVCALPFYQSEPKEFLNVHYSDGTFAPIIWCIPTYAKERKFFKKKGSAAFFDLTLEKEIDLADWNRPSAV